MPKDNQLSLVDQLFHPHYRNTLSAQFLMSMDKVIDLNTLVGIINVLDQSGTPRGSQPRHNPMLIVEALSLHHFYGLSDPQLEEQLKDRLSFRLRGTSVSTLHRIEPGPQGPGFHQFLEVQG